MSQAGQAEDEHARADAEAPPSPQGSARAGWALLGVGAALYLLTFLLYFPPTHAIEDEVGFLNMATVFSRGALTAEGAGFEELAEFAPRRAGRVGWRNPGRGLFTAPFLALGGYRAALASGALIHLALVFAAACALRALERSPAWALLLLFHPTFLIYSRAVMSDELGALGAGAALALALWRKPFLAGLALGMGCAARYQLAVATPFLAWELWRHDGPRAGAKFLAGAGALGLVILAYNLSVLGSPIGNSGQGFFSLRNVGPHLLHYTKALLLLWPGMLLAPVAYGLWRLGQRGAHVSPQVRRRVGLLLAASIPLTLLLLPYYFVDRDPAGRLHIELVIGQRLLQPALPGWILLYALLLARAWPERLRRLLPGLALATLALGAGGSFALQARHQRHLERYAAARDVIAQSVPTGSLLLANRTLNKLFEVPREDLPRYRLRAYHFHGQRLERPELLAETQPAYLAHLRKTRGEPRPAAWDELLAQHPRARLVHEDERLTLYEVPPPERR